LAIFIRDVARVFKAPWKKTSESLVDRASNLFGAVLKSYPVSSLTFAATTSAKPIKVLRPVPTAVPP